MRQPFHKEESNNTKGTFKRAPRQSVVCRKDYNDWTLSAQYSHKYVALGEHRNTGLSTVRLSKELLHNTLTLQDFAYIDVTNGGVYSRLSADYALNDQLHAMLGYDYFHADKGMFNIYKKNSEIWLKLKYSF